VSEISDENLHALARILPKLGGHPNLESLQRVPSMQVHAKMRWREEERERQQVERADQFSRRIASQSSAARRLVAIGLAPHP
jgi:hypothetical protein